jgi:hypothetical protein
MVRAAAFAVLLAACVGEAEVSYRGSVIEGPITGHAFDAAPAAGTPVVGATVALCFVATCSPPAASTLTAADGSYAQIDAVFGGFVGVDTHIEVRVVALDGRTASYAVTYENTTDPTNATPENGAPVFLDFSLAP